MHKTSFSEMKQRVGAKALKDILPGQFEGSEPYDPEMLYVECRNCGKPVLWEPGKTTRLLSQASINLESLDASCLIISDGCRQCKPGVEGYTIAVMRLASLAEEMLLVPNKPFGTA